MVDADELGEGEDQNAAFAVLLALIDEAIADEVENENPLAYQQKAQIHLIIGEFAEATAAFDRAEELYPEYFSDAGMGTFTTGELRISGWSMAYQRADSYRQENEFDSAVEYYNIANELYPRRPEAFMNKAVSLQNAGDIDGSIQAWYDAIEVMENPEFTPEDPEDVAQWESYLPMSRGNAGNLLSNIPERSEEAIAVLQVVVDEDPSNSSAQGTLAMLLSQSGAGEDAMAIFDDILASDEGDWTQYYNAGLSLYRAEDWARCALAFGKVLERAPKHRDAMDYRVWALRNAGQYAEQIEVSAALIELDPNNRLILQHHYQALSAEGAGQEELQPTLDRLLGLQFDLEGLTLAAAQEGGSVSGYFINKAMDPGATIKLAFTYYDDIGQAIGTTDVEIEVPDLDGETTLNISFDTDIPVVGYSYEVVE
ncbi:MAG: tetratricopeptide repeat protein [bacterium]